VTAPPKSSAPAATPSPSSTSPLRTALTLGRVSNLPTVWTNVMAGVAFNSEPTAAVIVPVALAASLLYVAGMFLNDAFDRKWDAEHRPERPIPAGAVTARTVFIGGFGLLALGLAILWVGPGGDRAVLPGLALAGLIVLYDASHKRNPVAPLVMALCRVAVYVTAARAAAPGYAPPLFAGAIFLAFYLVTLTLIARQETTDPKVPRLVGRLIAGISLVDGAQLLVLESYWLAGASVVAFALTRRLQRWVAGT
jgi:4-hydroxybenzoate polyprenyltransferase